MDAPKRLNAPELEFLLTRLASKDRFITEGLMADLRDHLAALEAELAQAKQWRCSICGGLVHFDGTSPSQ